MPHPLHHLRARHPSRQVALPLVTLDAGDGIIHLDYWRV